MKESYFSEEYDSKFLLRILSELDIDFNEVSLEKISEYTVNEGAVTIAEMILEDLKKNLDGMLSERKEFFEGFNTRLYEKWNTPLDLLEMFIVISIETAEEFGIQNITRIEDNMWYRFEVLRRLQSRACIIAQEILVLLKHGFADGALSRWRTLHEISVVANFISHNDEIVAERYYLHSSIESYKGMNEFQKHARKLNQKPFSIEELLESKEVRDDLISRFGKCYSNSYGWAAEAIGKCDPSISQLEEAAGINHLRPYYRMSSHSVHANPKGIMFKLAKVDFETLLFGPSNTGLTNPAHCAAISLNQINACLLSLAPTIMIVASLKMMGSIVNEIGEAVLRVEQEDKS